MTIDPNDATADDDDVNEALKAPPKKPRSRAKRKVNGVAVAASGAARSLFEIIDGLELWHDERKIAYATMWSAVTVKTSGSMGHRSRIGSRTSSTRASGKPPKPETSQASDPGRDGARRF